MPDHVMPDQVMPDQVMPDQVMPDQVMPDQVMPDQVIPDHVMPLQLAVFRRPAAQLRASKDRPRTSTSPRTVRPPTVTCTEPRASSSEPTPVDTAKVCFALTGVGAALAARRSSTPAPCSATVAPATGDADCV